VTDLVHLHSLLGEGVGDLQQRLAGHDAGVVDKDVDLAEVLLDLLRERVDALTVGDVSDVGPEGG
jgi:hypothetical protein